MSRNMNKTKKLTIYASESESESEYETEIEEKPKPKKSKYYDSVTNYYDDNDKSWYNLVIHIDNNPIKLKEIIENKDKYKTHENITKIFNYANTYDSYKYKNFFVKYIDEIWGFDKLDEIHINQIMEYNNLYIYVVREMIRRNIKLSNVLSKRLFGTYNYVLIKLAIEKELVECTSEHLEILFLDSYYSRNENKIEIMEIIDTLLKNKVLLTPKCFENLIETNKLIIDGDYYKNDHHSIFENENQNDMTELINLMYNFGFNITQDNFKTMIKNRIYIDNYKKYKLVLDKEIEDLCNDITYFPYEEINITEAGFKKIMKCDIKLVELKKIIKKYNFNLDTNSLELACSRSDIDAKTISYLMNDCNIQPNFECLDNLLNREKILKKVITCVKDIVARLKVTYGKHENDNLVCEKPKKLHKIKDKTVLQDKK